MNHSRSPICARASTAPERNNSGDKREDRGQAPSTKDMMVPPIQFSHDFPRLVLVGLLLIIAISGSSCASTSWISKPDVQLLEKPEHTVSLRPAQWSWFHFGDPDARNSVYRAFRLRIKNNSTTERLVIDWQKTLYIRNKVSRGVFYFFEDIHGDDWSAINAPKPPDVIFPGGELTRDIRPRELVKWEEGDSEHAPYYYSGGMPSGENGVYLNYRIGADSDDHYHTITVILSLANDTRAQPR